MKGVGDDISMVSLYTAKIVLLYFKSTDGMGRDGGIFRKNTGRRYL